MPTFDDLQNHFDLDEANYNELLKDPSVVAATELYLNTLLPKLEPYIKTGIDMGAAAAGAASSGALPGSGPLVAASAKLLANGGLAIVERWLAQRASVLQPPPPPPPAA